MISSPGTPAKVMRRSILYLNLGKFSKFTNVNLLLQERILPYINNK